MSSPQVLTLQNLVLVFETKQNSLSWSLPGFLQKLWSPIPWEGMSNSQPFPEYLLRKLIWNLYSTYRYYNTKSGNDRLPHIWYNLQKFPVPSSSRFLPSQFGWLPLCRFSSIFCFQKSMCNDLFSLNRNIIIQYK